MKKSYTADRCKNLVIANDEGSLILNTFARNGYPGKQLPDDQLEKLCSIGSFNIKEQQNWNIDWHRNEGLEITLLLSGNLIFQTKENKTNLSSNNLTLTRPWQAHKLGDKTLNACKLFWIIIDLSTSKPNQKWQWPSWICLRKQDLLDIEEAVAGSKDCIWVANSKIETIAKDIDNFIKTNNSENSLSFLAVKINELLLEFFNLIKSSPAKHTHNPTLYTIELFLNELMSNKDILLRKWTIEDMAYECFTNQTTFYKFCKKITNLTPSNYLNFARVTYSTKLIKEFPNMQITEIAGKSGFETSQYYSKVFKQYLKCTPLEFKKSLTED